MARTERELKAQTERALRERLQRPLARGLRALSLEVLARVSERSPVDTGRFRMNWQVGVGERPQGELPLESGGQAGGDVVRQLNDLEREVRPIFVVNNLPYSERLEDGYSQQAPEGIVAVTVSEMRTYGKDIMLAAMRSTR